MPGGRRRAIALFSGLTTPDFFSVGGRTTAGTQADVAMEGDDIGALDVLRNGKPCGEPADDVAAAGASRDGLVRAW